MKYHHFFAIVSFLLIHPTESTFAHSGGLASDGCHFNHKLGTRHCHRGKDGEISNEVNISGAKVYVYNSDLFGNMAFRNISVSINELWRIYEKNPETFYCGCEISEKQPIHSSCGYMDSSPFSSDIEWEHIVPISTLAKNTPAYLRGNNKCILENGKRYRGRKCASKIDERFQAMESDLYNLVPVIGTVNRMRSNFRFAEIDGEQQALKGCDFKIGEVFESRKRKKAVEPRDQIKGFIARVYLYMTYAYRNEFRMWGDEKELMANWNSNFPPDEWECNRAKNIEFVQGNRNRIVFERCSENEITW